MERFLSRMLISMAAAVTAMILVPAAVIFLCTALYLFLVSLSAAPPLAAFLTGLTGLALAGLIILGCSMASRRAQTERAAAGQTRGDTGAAPRGGNAPNVNDLVAKLGDLAVRELASQVQAHPYRTVVVSLLAGLAVGGIPELRNVLGKILKD